MKDSLRQCTSWLHTWTGLVVGWVLFFVFVTGTAGYFQHEITRWMQPERDAPRALVLDEPEVQRLVQLGLDRLDRMAPEAASWRITLPHVSLPARSWQEFGIRWEQVPEPGHDFGVGTSELLDPVTGAVLAPGVEPRATSGGRGLYVMHYALHYMPFGWAVRIVGVCTMLMLLAIITGVITHKKIFKDFFTFRPGKGQRSWLDAHNAISVMALPFFLMITYSGLVFFLFTYVPAGRDVIYGSGQLAESAYFDELFEEGAHKHAAIRRPTIAIAPLVHQAVMAWGPGQLASLVIERHEGEPPEIVLARAGGGQVDFRSAPTLRFNADNGEPLGDEPKPGGGAVATQGILFDLHEGLFADVWGRWLYFIAGLLGCAMIATGLVLWTVKRRKHHLASGREVAEPFGVRLVEILNVATIAGLPLAVAAYFWANRLLPIGLADRAAWELHALFAVWLATLFYALGRPLARGWIELLWATSLAYALVPVLNALTTDRHLGRSLPDGDWVIAGFDLTMLALGALFAVMAVKVRRRLVAPSAAGSGMPVKAVGKAGADPEGELRKGIA